MKSRNDVVMEIERDINNGVYNNFKKLESRLKFIATKLRLVNGLVSRGEIKTLQENEYIPQNQLEFEY